MTTHPLFCSLCNRKLEDHSNKELVFCALKITSEVKK